MSGERGVLSDNRCKRFYTVTEVYVTRRITYTFANAEILAIAAKRLSPDKEDETPNSASAPTPTVQQINIDGAFVNDDEKPVASPISIVNPDTLRTAVANSLNQGKVGEGLVFDTFTARGAQFSQEFERPVVIGFDAVVTPFPTANYPVGAAFDEAPDGPIFESCIL
ncbi:hypothetical protein ACS3SW_20610 [Roseobacteraceae bacterium S113]